MVVNVCKPRLPCACSLSWRVRQPPSRLTASLTLPGPGRGPAAASPQSQPRLQSWRGWSSCVGSPAGKAPRMRQDRGQPRSRGAPQAAGMSGTSVGMWCEVQTPQVSQHLMPGPGDAVSQDRAVCRLGSTGRVSTAATCQYEGTDLASKHGSKVGHTTPRPPHVCQLLLYPVSQFVLSDEGFGCTLSSRHEVEPHSTLASRQEA